MFIFYKVKKITVIMLEALQI